MKKYSIKNLRNVGLMGYNGIGKIFLVESILYYLKIIDRLGDIEDGIIVLDFDIEERKRKFFIFFLVVLIELDDVKINIIDIFGYVDF